MLKTLSLKYWGIRLLGKLIQYNSAQHSGLAQDLSFQQNADFAFQVNKRQRQPLLHNFLFIFSFTRRRILWKKSTTERINKPTVYLSQNLLSLIHKLQSNRCNILVGLEIKHFYTSLQQSDVAMVFFMVSTDQLKACADYTTLSVG